MRLLGSIFMGAVFFGSVGCAGNSCETPPNPAVFEIGTGDLCFQRLTAGQTVPVNDGPQGGFHLWAAIGCADCGKKVTVEFGAKDPATKAWLNTIPSKVVVDLTGDDWGQFAGLTAFLPGDTFDNSKDKLPKGTHVLLSVRAIGSDKKELHAGEVEVVLGDDQESSCSSEDSCGTDGLAPCCGSGNEL